MNDFSIKKILIPVDRDHPSLHAIEYGVILAKKFDSKVNIIHVIPSDIIREISELDLNNKLKAELKGHLEQNGRIAISNAKAILTEEGIPIETSHLEYGNAKDTIREMSRNFDLIVIGSNGEEESYQWRLMPKEISNSKSNILVIKGKKPFEKVLVGYDGSKASKTALRYASEICWRFGASLLVVHATKSNAPVIRNITAEKSEALLTEAKDMIKNIEISKNFKSISQKPAEGLSEIAEKEDIGLIVIGKNGRSLINRLVMGSVSEKIIDIAQTSVLTVRPFIN
ncbi:MAG: universal stress protein [Candidatus Thorarchaeota archaeon]